jgi:hypothetical protein
MVSTKFLNVLPPSCYMAIVLLSPRRLPFSIADLVSPPQLVQLLANDFELVDFSETLNLFVCMQEVTRTDRTRMGLDRHIHRWPGKSIMHPPASSSQTPTL